MTWRLDVLAPGVQTSVQDLGGRRGLWRVGVPPSGAYDTLSFALANAAVGNDPGAAGLEAVLGGPTLRFTASTGSEGSDGGTRGPLLAAVTGACGEARLNGRAVRPGEPFAAYDGDVLAFGPCGPAGLRGYLAVRGGLAVDRVLGSRATFLLGGFGGGTGSALAAGDVLGVGRDENCAAPAALTAVLPALADRWTLRVIPGPHGAPDYFTGDALAELFAAVWTVDHRSDRTGTRLAGPAVRFARDDGGEAGLHPCNIHDSAYPVGGIMISGDTPVIVGPDGPSLGGFVVPAGVIQADLWKLGQLRPGDRVRLEPVTPAQAEIAREERRRLLADPRAAAAAVIFPPPPAPSAPPPGTAAQPDPQPDARPDAQLTAQDRPAPLLSLPAQAGRPELSVRLSGDHHLLVEVGPARLDLTVRARIHLLHRELTARAQLTAAAGVPENVEGVRSLLLGFDPAVLDPRELAARVGDAWLATPDPAGVELPVREVTMPICFDDPDAHEAMRRYQRGVRPDAPWCPDNVEFIRRVNGLRDRDEVFEIVQKATYLVIGLGDVYLGAPLAVPLDPAHRLVTTKYDPPRTWTPENAVGIGGAYLCVYGMEGPGGYQLVGRTVPVWRKPAADQAGRSPEPAWLLRNFDLLRFEPVGHDELLELRAAVADGTIGLSMRETTLDLGTLPGPDTPQPPETMDFIQLRERAFAAERARWAQAAAAKTGA
ncbi:5-oxoprolinase/urea amidolyase family protein [Actinospica durhamensis]|uniref:5-oxoprolinase/urea amidolyase family protein n=1 Tax=Actinospica durhamensis TaxID=1508375 RepID=A0A941EV04_9ACTN|nr:5-oxoprolinase/urea amidolyase family protein [Actinospica durhamensis]MBR7834409.1 5-oxoprolinase/urea amidolyase family protein [Actinospica durhamensis]